MVITTILITGANRGIGLRLTKQTLPTERVLSRAPELTVLSIYLARRCSSAAPIRQFMIHSRLSAAVDQPRTDNAPATAATLRRP